MKISLSSKELQEAVVIYLRSKGIESKNRDITLEVTDSEDEAVKIDLAAPETKTEEPVKKTRKTRGTAKKSEEKQVDLSDPKPEADNVSIAQETVTEAPKSIFGEPGNVNGPDNSSLIADEPEEAPKESSGPTASIFS